jgi:integrase
LKVKPHKPRISRKGVACPYKGRPTGAKASYTREQYKSIRASFTGTYADRDRLLFAFDTSQGWRASEVCDLRWSDVLFPDGVTFRPSVVYSSTRQKGGWPKPEGWTPPPPKPSTCVEGCNCRMCKIRRGEVTPKPRRPPDTRDVPLSPQLHAELRGWLEKQQNHPRGWSIDDFVFQSRKRDDFGKSRPISRQQLWWIIKQTIKRAKLIDPTLMDVSKYGTHSMRRTAINGVNNRSKDIGVAMKFANHRNRATTSVYLESDPRLVSIAVLDEAAEFLAA